MTIKLQIGKIYVRRDGIQVEIVGKNNSPVFPFIADSRDTYTEDGRYDLIYTDDPNPKDLVSER